jgi:broad-specificity NMP kinase
MFNVCPNCGIYDVEKDIIESKAQTFAKCRHCAYMHPFKKLPLLLLTGASGAGKSSVALKLVSKIDKCFVMDKDILWSDYYSELGSDALDFYELWLRVAKNMAQNGKPVLLCGSMLPDSFNKCKERRYFSDLHPAALICDDTVLRQRLEQRPGWRESGTEDYISRHVAFNQWIRKNASTSHPPIKLFDTTTCDLDSTVNEIIHWIKIVLTDPGESRPR